MSRQSEASASIENRSPIENKNENIGGKSLNDKGKLDDDKLENNGNLENDCKLENGVAKSSKEEENRLNNETETEGSHGKEYQEYSKNGEDNKSGYYPVQIFVILCSDFCERFAWHGVRTILTLFLTQELLYDDNAAVLLVHGTFIITYFTPLVGAIIADSWLGRFRTIFYVSIIYAIGNIILSIGSIPMDKTKMATLSLIGIVVVSAASGFIRPNITAFGGDQYREDQVKERMHFYSIFYFIRNAGSLFSMLLAPIIREQVHCLGNDNCYLLAFSVPALVMFAFTIIFILGKRLYVLAPVHGSVFFDVYNCIIHALSQKLNNKGVMKDHWLDYAENKYSMKQIKDIKALLNVLFLFLPIPIFWCLFGQQGSTFVLQATKMDGQILGFVIQPDQMPAINPLLVIILIPFFEYVVYPLLTKCNVLKTPLKRMVAGMILTALSFVVAGLLELSLEEALPKFPEEGNTEIRFVNNSPCKINVTGEESRTLDAFQNIQSSHLKIGKETFWNFEPSDCDVKSGVKKTFKVNDPLETMMIIASKKELKIMMTNDTIKKSKKGDPLIRVLFSVDFQFIKGKNGSFLFRGSSQLNIIPDYLSKDSKAGMTDYCSMKPGRYKIYIPHNTTAFVDLPVGEHDFLAGGNYIVVIFEDKSKNVTKFSVEETLKHNSVPILYQLIQYAIMTAGEILFAVTGLEFAYSQAPQDLKSVLQAAWLLTEAFGNVIIVIMKEAVGTTTKQSLQFFLFAVVMLVGTLIFAILAYFYRYVDEHKGLVS